MVAHFWWATWAICSHCSFLVSNLSKSLICHEQPEQFAHRRSFVLRDLSKSLTVTHVIWANEQMSDEQMSDEQMSDEQMSDERMSEFPALSLTPWTQGQDQGGLHCCPRGCENKNFQPEPGSRPQFCCLQVRLRRRRIRREEKAKVSLLLGGQKLFNS